MSCNPNHPTSSSSSAAASSSASGGATTKSKLLSQSDKERLKKIFDSLDPSQMWTLSSGTILGNRQLFFTNRQYQPFSLYHLDIWRPWFITKIYSWQFNSRTIYLIRANKGRYSKFKRGSIKQTKRGPTCRRLMSHRNAFMLPFQFYHALSCWWSTCFLSTLPILKSISSLNRRKIA